jgi:hypothetical protein
MRQRLYAHAPTWQLQARLRALFISEVLAPLGPGFTSAVKWHIRTFSRKIDLADGTSEVANVVDNVTLLVAMITLHFGSWMQPDTIMSHHTIADLNMSQHQMG